MPAGKSAQQEVDVEDELAELRGKLASEIPVTQHLGLEVVSWDAGGLVLAAPLAKNVNHQGAAFAGSVNAVASLAGWGWAWLALRRAGVSGHVVLQDSAIRYLRPITGDFTARCPAPDRRTLEHMLEGMKRHRRGRLSLAVEVQAGDVPVAAFEGRFVALGVDP